MALSLFAGCGSVQAKDSGNKENANNKETSEAAQSEQDTPEVTQQAAEGEETMTADEQTTPEVVQTQEIWVQNGNDRIYGVAYVPAAEETANMIWITDEAGSLPLPLKRLTICPMPKVNEDTMIAVFRLSFSIARNRSPRKMTSSKKPTQHILITYRSASYITRFSLQRLASW